MSADIFFDEAHAARYDERFAALAPMTQALHLLMRSFLKHLPEDARILCVGAGTGAELMALAPHFPGWRFVAVDPSAAMLAVCRSKAEAAGFAQRCDFHEGYLASLPKGEAFDAATCVLVSQFLTDRAERVSLFRGIVEHLRPDAWLISADLSADLDCASGDALLEQWMSLMRLSGMSSSDLDRLRAAYGRDVGILPPSQVESMLAEAGFATAIPIYHALLFHAWGAARSPSRTSAHRPNLRTLHHGIERKDADE